MLTQFGEAGLNSRGKDYKPPKILPLGQFYVIANINSGKAALKELNLLNLEQSGVVHESVFAHKALLQLDFLVKNGRRLRLDRSAVF